MRSDQEFREFRARLVGVHDGDNVRLVMDQGFDVTVRKWLRLRDVFAPELSHTGGQASETFVRNWLGRHFHRDPPTTWPWLVRTYRTSGDNDVTTFGRYVADVSCVGCGASLNAAVQAFLADHKEWGGGTGG